MRAALVLALLQAPSSISDWTVTPAHPTVGDTIWIEWRVTAPAGWRVRPVPLQPVELLEPLGGPVARYRPEGWVARYPVVAWAPGAARAAPPILLLGPGGRMDSLTADTARFEVRSVLAQAGVRNADSATPQPALAPFRSERRDPWSVALAMAAVLGGLFAGLSWRHRGPRRVVLPLRVPLDPEVSDERWLAAGEPRAVAARAAGYLRQAIARAVPGAHIALSTEECLAAVQHERPDAPLRDLGAVLRALDQVAFASAHGADVGALAGRARTLARELAP